MTTITIEITRRDQELVVETSCTPFADDITPEEKTLAVYIYEAIGLFAAPKNDAELRLAQKVENALELRQQDPIEVKFLV